MLILYLLFHHILLLCFSLFAGSSLFTCTFSFNALKIIIIVLISGYFRLFIVAIYDSDQQFSAFKIVLNSYILFKLKCLCTLRNVISVFVQFVISASDIQLYKILLFVFAQLHTETDMHLHTSQQPCGSFSVSRDHMYAF